MCVRVRHSGYYPGLAVGATQEPSWWPTALQYSHGVPKGVLNENVAVVEAKEKAAAEAQAKAEVCCVLHLCLCVGAFGCVCRAGPVMLEAG